MIMFGVTVTLIVAGYNSFLLFILLLIDLSPGVPFVEYIQCRSGFLFPAVPVLWEPGPHIIIGPLWPLIMPLIIKKQRAIITIMMIGNTHQKP